MRKTFPASLGSAAGFQEIIGHQARQQYRDGRVADRKAARKTLVCSVYKSSGSPVGQKIPVRRVWPRDITVLFPSDDGAYIAGLRYKLPKGI